ncbi:hypothetical protein GCM10007939_13220 [Amylibacter marinus]|uniref:DUF306 domain-containing protein n=1 Tax=Amylibacter marinus TaxID=1475483 RepID=A0ABQ5VV51_9RHOB|nr:META domain-containing protein [Amylibacter marinus]GLQ35039.1 hypothetical protein GCM10007939_13220 [Amylibacter marinus]
MYKFLVLCALPLSACAADETISGYVDADAIWVLRQMDQQPVHAQITLQFPAKGQARGQAPCNSYHAQQTAPLPWFQLGPIAATKRACPDLPLETRYFSALSRATMAESTGNTLILSDDDGLELIYQRR